MIRSIYLWMILFISIATPGTARADFWGGDIPLLIQIVSNTTAQLTQLKQILGNGQETLNLIRDINNGVREAMRITRTMNNSMQSGVLGQFQSPDEALRAIQQIYGAIPKSSESQLQALNDRSVAEAVTLHNQAFQFADAVDPEAERIKDYARDVSPTGAGKLTAQSLGVLIHVSNQILRTNAAMLKLLSQNLALQNRKEKINSQQFQMQYEGLSSAFRSTPSFKESSKLNP